MKATGIVRRVDDLGRIVIPKEIRRTLRIREGDPLEIYTEKDGGVIFRKYSPMGDLQEFATQMCEAIGGATGRIVFPPLIFHIFYLYSYLPLYIYFIYPRKNILIFTFLLPLS